MARRRGLGILSRGRDERSSIGDLHVEEAITALNKTCAATVATMTRYDFTREQTLPMLFRDDDLAKLRAVQGMVATSTNKHYDITPMVSLGMSYDGANLPSIEPSRLHIQHDRASPLLHYIAEVRAIHMRFEEVKAVLKWLNRNATAGAIRYYWPTALQLCPRSAPLIELAHVPTRYSIPSHMGDWLQALRDAAATVAGSLLLPTDAVPKTRETMWLTFDTVGVDASVTNNGYTHCKYQTDTQHYSI